jgi:probable DNA repair protein
MHDLDTTFIRHLDAGGTVLTAGYRQSRIVRRLYDQAQRDGGRACWPQADVLPLGAWLAGCWRAAAEADRSLPTLLGDAQALWPWRRAAVNFVDSSLVPLHDLAGAARRAWLRLHAHGGNLELLEREWLTRDQQRFRDWARHVEGRLAAEGWMDPERLETALAERAATLDVPGPILFAGFDRPTPSLLRLVEALRGRGVAVEFAAVASRAVAGRLLEAVDTAAETAAWLGWARARLEADPAARLAVIVPDLQERRGALERDLASLLQPELELPGSPGRDRIFDLAGGEPLRATGIGRAAIDCLACAQPRIELDGFSRLLRSRHVLPGDDPERRIRLDVVLRQRGVPAWPPQPLARLAAEAGCHGAAAALEGGAGLLSGGPGHRSADAWAGAFGEVLAAWGWPGGGGHASDEFQAAGAVRERLAELAGLRRTAPSWTRGEAQVELERLLAGPFQPERGYPSLWILDELEPPGVAFDGLWVSGLTATRWPRPATQDPFLPLALQRRLGMPGATAEDALASSLATVSAWRGSAAEVVFSWPRRIDDADAEPSRALPAGLESMPYPSPPDGRAVRLLRASRLEPAGPDAAPRLAGKPRGGARILDLQARCPFRAFAELRLAAAPLEEPGPGVDARLRGNVFHKALEFLWRELGGREGLVGAEPASLDALVDDALDRAMARELPAGLGPRTRALEREWQHAAIERLLEVERQRPDFVVAQVEGRVTRSLAGLDLDLRVDRVDRVEAGLLILDYKTGRASTGQWRGARPDAPQLPLYAALAGDEACGVAFVRAGPHAAGFAGVGSVAGLAPGIEPASRFRPSEDEQAGLEWPALRRRWAAWLGALARAHVEGEATVDPKQPDTCRSCHLPALCRVQRGVSDGDEEPGDD